MIADLHRLDQLASLEQRRLKDEVNIQSLALSTDDGSYHIPPTDFAIKNLTLVDDELLSI